MRRGNYPRGRSGGIQLLRKLRSVKRGPRTGALPLLGNCGKAPGGTNIMARNIPRCKKTTCPENLPRSSPAIQDDQVHHKVSILARQFFSKLLGAIDPSSGESQMSDPESSKTNIPTNVSVYANSSTAPFIYFDGVACPARRCRDRASCPHHNRNT
jgi:hypothetical protein